MRVKPAAGLKIRVPFTLELLDEHSEPVEVPATDFFWSKLLEHGDVVEVAPQSTPAE